jgi:tetratricopeptide (TPR) repeat protein
MQQAERCLSAGRFAEAERLCREVLQQRPTDAGALNLLAVALRQQGNISAALEIAARAAALYSNVAELQANVGEFSRLAGKLEQSVAAFERAISLRPAEPTFHNSLGLALFDCRRFAEAAEEYRRAIQIRGDYADAYNNLGGVLRELGRQDEAIGAIETALKINPRFASAYLNLALVFTDREEFARAAESYRRAIEIDPNAVQAHWSLGTLLLLQGDFAGGWREYQWRPAALPRLAKPMWAGEDLRGKTILVYAEQGLGDTIQFVRYVPLLKQRGARVLLACQVELQRLLGGMAEMIAPGRAIAPHDFYCPLLSLPLGFHTELSTIPAEVPYLRASDELLRVWAERVGRKTGRLRVGLAWAGRPQHREDARRSIRFERLKPILAKPDVEFVSLQKGAAAEEARGSGMLDLTAELGDLADAAALIQQLDLVITVDTAIAHLAGALGKPAWVLLARIPDWRWLLERSDSPWYPTLRLFRQRVRGDWETPIRDVATALATFGRDGAPV